MKTNIKTAVIGVGNMGKHHARIYSEISNLVAVADLNEEVGKMIADKYGTKYYKNYHGLLNKEKIEAVSVAVPSVFHRKVVIDCLSSKIPTLVEKPIAEKIKDANAMIEEASKQKTLLMVGHIERFNPAIIKLKEIVKNKKLGKIINLLALRIGLHPPVMTGLDVAVDLSIHDIDIFNFLLDEIPKRKKIVKNKIFPGSIADSSSFILEYEKTTGMIHSNWVTPVKIRKLFVSGSEGFAELDYISQKLIIFQKMNHEDKQDDYLNFLTYSDTPQKIEFVSKKEPLKEELKFFLKNYKNYKLTKVAKEAMLALETITA